MTQKSFGLSAPGAARRYSLTALREGTLSNGLVSIKPWGVIEWVAVKFGLLPDTYRVIYDNDELFTV
jgi:hypothetical protein